MQGGFLLDVVIRQCAAILKLLSSKDQPLLVWRDSLFILNFSLDIFNAVRRFHLKGDSLARQGLHKDLHDLCFFRKSPMYSAL